MGVVHEAVHRQRGRREALKRIREDLGADPAFAARFEREVRSLARVAHDHVVPLYDSGRVGDVLYYTMAFLPGPSLARLLEEVRGVGEIEPGRAALGVLDRHGIAPVASAAGTPAVAYARRLAGAFAGAAEALYALHAAGVLHRDVKPGNLVLDERHRVVLTDFGLAREEASRLTQVGETVGTPAYMAPEQLRAGTAVDGRADVYGLGAALYEAWTLHAPHEGRSVAETLALVLRGAVRPARGVNPGLPRSAEAILARCLAARPDDRYADASALASDLRAFSRGEPVAARPLSRAVRLLRRIAPWRAPIAAAAVLLVGLGAIVHFQPAHVSVITVPVADVWIDGESAGRSPIADRSVAAGEHRIVARLEGFVPFDRTVPLGRGARYALDVAMRPIDPADPVALRRLAEALKVERTEVDVKGLRGPRDPKDGPPALVLWPRGARRAAPTEIVLWAEVPAHDVRLVIERVGAEGKAERVHEETIATVFQRQPAALSGPVASRLVGAGSYRVVLSASDGKEWSVASFSVASADAAREADTSVDRTLARLDAEDPAKAVLRADLWIGQGRYEEALATAIDLRERLGERREVARLAIAALEGAGLKGSAPWVSWAETWTKDNR